MVGADRTVGACACGSAETQQGSVRRGVSLTEPEGKGKREQEGWGSTLSRSSGSHGDIRERL